MSTDSKLWQTKLAARIHDPAEKALVLLRDPAGHEGGTSRVLMRLLGLASQAASLNDDPQNENALARVVFRNGLDQSIYRNVQRADWWAAAADRPQWPMEEITVTTRSGEQKTLKVADWAQVRWTKKPVLIHPLTGAQFDLGQHGGLGDTDIDDIKERSFDHFSGLLKAVGGELDDDGFRKALLAFWRFGPELDDENDNGKLGALWPLLPADTRVPDHSIWDHLDLTSAFAGAFAADPDGEAALLSMSIGPVQPFIAAARSTSDLWAGSHLLARLAWEAMRPVCESLGPDAILFPRLRGVPQVDVWLRDRIGLPDALFEGCEWNKGATDSNPLFSAALPNRFVAVVPRSQAKNIATNVEKSVRQWLQNLGIDVVSRLLHEAGFDVEGTQTTYDQMRQQLDGFPEVHWAVVPFSLISPRNKEKQTDLDTVQLSAAMAPFFGKGEEQPCGFLDTPAWKVLQKELCIDASGGNLSVFFAPNPGVLYPAIHDLAERTLAAAKALRPFDQRSQEGWRDSLSGEAEWLTTDCAQLFLPPGQRSDTLWTKIAKQKPSWAKQGEHLGALSAIKRLWPSIFAEEVGKALAAGERGEMQAVGRFVVSTHTMALAHQLEQWLEHGQAVPDADQVKFESADSVALPRRLLARHARNPRMDLARRLPALLEDAENEADADHAAKFVRQILATDENPNSRLETYYALIMMDGDRMGSILSGDPACTISYRESFHPQVLAGFDRHAERNPQVHAYGAQKRAISPNRHLAISGALNDFSLTVARHVVEHEHLGRIIYAGGDDLLAMLPVADLLSTMQRLRCGYSGHDPEHAGGRDPRGLTLHKGFAVLQRSPSARPRLMRMMGEAATASCGAVIAHHKAPLAAVRRELEAAEKRAKQEGGRDAFSITVIKRSGGTLRFTAHWGEPLRVLVALHDFLTADGVSRRAVYNSLEWLVDLPEPEGDGQMLKQMLSYQFDRQSNTPQKPLCKPLAARLVDLALQQPRHRLDWLRNALGVAEFLARETRQPMQQEAHA